MTSGDVRIRIGTEPGKFFWSAKFEVGRRLNFVTLRRKGSANQNTTAILSQLNGGRDGPSLQGQRYSRFSPSKFYYTLSLVIFEHSIPSVWMRILS